MLRSDGDSDSQEITAEARGLLRALLRLNKIRYRDPASEELVREGLATMVDQRLAITLAGRQYAQQLAVPKGRFRRDPQLREAKRA
jgi:hypothetical protein